MKKAANAMPNQRLIDERLRRHWSQKIVADRVGTTSVNVSRWERGITSPGSYFRSQLCALFEKNPEELGLVLQRMDGNSQEFPFQVSQHMHTQPATPVRTPLFCNIPYRRNPFFTGRDAVLKSLHTTLHKGKTAIVAQGLSISGLGGIGKTQVAIEYAYRSCNEYQAILWVRAQTRTILIADLLVIADLLNLGEKSESSQPQRVIEGVKEWLRVHSDWLLILDNVEDVTIVSDILPMQYNGHVLLTTRAQATGELSRRIDLELMHPDEATLLLLRRARLLTPDIHLEEISVAERKAVSDIADLVDGLPLALDQVGAYIEETGCTFSEYLNRYQDSYAALLARRGGSVLDHPLSVRATFSLSFERIECLSPAASDVLRFCAFLHPDAIPEELLLEDGGERGYAFPSLATDPLTWDAAIAALRTCSLLRRNAEAKTLSIHRLVQAVLKDMMDEHTRYQWAEQAVRAMSKCFPDGNEAIMWPRCQRLLPHAEVCIQLIEQWKLISPAAGQLLNHLGTYLRERGQYFQAEILLNKARDIRVQVLGAEHSDVAQSLNDLAALYGCQGRYSEAEPLLLRALTIREEQSGQPHVDVAHSLNDLALNYWYQGRYSEAEPLFLRALDILERQIGSEHSFTVNTLNNLAILYHRQGRYSEAEPLQKRALAIDEQQLGPENLHTARDLHNLARLYRDQGRYSEAEPLFLRTLDILERQIGLENAYAAQNLTNLAVLYRCQGRSTESESLFLRALTIREKLLGPDNHHTAHSLINIAVLYREQSRYREAEEFLHRALVILDQQLGSQHPDTAECLHNLAELYLDQGRYVEGEPVGQQALTIREKVLGSEHPGTAETLHILARLYHAQGEYKQAEVCYQRALDIREKMLGAEHPDVVTIRECYIGLLSEQ